MPLYQVRTDREYNILEGSTTTGTGIKPQRVPSSSWSRESVQLIKWSLRRKKITQSTPVEKKKRRQEDRRNGKLPERTGDISAAAHLRRHGHLVVLTPSLLVELMLKRISCQGLYKFCLNLSRKLIKQWTPGPSVYVSSWR
jgi:hypothetical protein